MRLIYVDTSAALKRGLPEPESRALVREMAGASSNGVLFVTSQLTRVEIARALKRRSVELIADPAEAFTNIMDGIGQAPITELVIEFARSIGTPLLRSLDAVHLATATALAAHELWSYDVRMCDEARKANIPARMPGRDSMEA
ncbi:PIN domain-containing protein [Microbacterium sp. ARD32]|uniref:PIN domain-containing protein n=1 Tax=Microbacterium sp. ARD32 TaxID=2962577 RepID=UPI002880CEB3|nr:PIN domain-containing protein [Microbacterium sp. ARD32]MDT0158045.1 PIN domain-containing protein [Microbacterium sp. ARD32]